MSEVVPAHVELGASASERWRACLRSPSFISELRQLGRIPENSTNIYAAEGTVAHTIAAERLVCKPTIFEGDLVIQDGFTIEVTDEMITAVMDYVAYVRSHWRPGVEVWIERSLTVPGSDKELRGTTDAAIIVPFSHIEIVDYKHGAGKKVDARNNPQLLYYACGVLFALPEDMRQDIGQVRTTIVQPRCAGGGITTCTYSLQEVYEFYTALLADAAAVSPDADFVAGEHCRWCPAAALCPATAAKASQIAQARFADVKVSRLPAAEALTVEQLLQVLDNADTMRDWLNNVEGYAKAAIDAGAHVPGYTVEPRYGHAKWKDESQAAAVLAPLGDAAYVHKLITPAVAKPAAKKAKLSIDLDALTVRPESSRALIKVGEDAPTSPPRAVQLFSPVAVQEEPQQISKVEI